MESIGQIKGGNMSGIAAMEHSHMLANPLAQTTDPKFQNSKFLQFVSRIICSELIVGKNQIKPATGSISADWADEYQAQYNVGPNSWADQFVHEELSQGTDKWVNEFAEEHQLHEVDQWVNEFSKVHVQDWTEVFGHQVSEGLFGKSSADNWVDAYDKSLYEQLLVSEQRSSTSRGVCLFYYEPLCWTSQYSKGGQELFCKGLLNEPILSLEAEVLKNPNNAKGWRFLGIKHAENDDDQHAIASMIASAMFTIAKKHVDWGQPIMS